MNTSALAVAIQIAESAATLLTSVWVYGRFGLEVQGRFGLLRSWFDAAATAAAFGFPQALLHLLYRRHVEPAALVWRMGIGLAALAVVSVGIAAAVSFTRPWVAMVALSVPFAVAHLLARGVLLHKGGAIRFAIATALPAQLILAGAVAVGFMGWEAGLEWAILVGAVLAGVSTFAWAARIAGPRRDTAWHPVDFFRVSLNSGVQVALNGAFAAVLFSAALHQGRGDADLGVATLVWQSFQVVVVGVGYASPLIFDRLARNTQALPFRWGPGARRAAWTTAAVGTGLLIAGRFPPGDHPWLTSSGLLVLAGLAAIGARVGATVLLASERYGELSLQAVARLALAWVGMSLAPPSWSPGEALGCTLLIVEGATLARMARLAPKA